MSESGTATGGDISDPYERQQVFINSQGDLARTVDPASLFGLLADDVRRRTFAAIELGAQSIEAISSLTNDTERDVAAAVHKLAAGGLLYREREGYRIDVHLLRAVASAASPKTPTSGDEFSDLRAERAAVLRSFIRDGRLVTMPSAGPKREVVLEHIATTFEPGMRYSEKEVSATLRAWHSDYAMLRRYLVDAGLLSRDHGEYWRSGGWVDASRG